LIISYVSFNYIIATFIYKHSFSFITHFNTVSSFFICLETIPGGAKVLQHFLFRMYLDLRKWSTLDLFLKRCAVKSSTKSSIKKFSLTYSGGFSILNMNDLHGSAMSQHNKKVLRTFCFRIWICSYNLCWAFHGTSFGKKLNSLSFS
jgi:hypothetical protein